MATMTPTAATTDLRTGLLGRLPADRLVIRCAHGTTTSYLLLGSDDRRNQAALELVRQRHSDRIGCTCEPERVS